jgi:hypothetical protein
MMQKPEVNFYTERQKLLDAGYGVLLPGSSLCYLPMEFRKRFLIGLLRAATTFGPDVQRKIGFLVQVHLGATLRPTLVGYFQERGDFHFKRVRSLQNGPKRRYYNRYEAQSKKKPATALTGRAVIR